MFSSLRMDCRRVRVQWRRFGNNKWISTVASIWIQCSSGASYAFAIYSPILKSTQNYDQTTLDSVAFFKDVGANVGTLSGLLYSAESGGPWVVHAAGAVLCFVGYFFIWLSVTGTLPPPPVPFMCLYIFLAAQAQTFFNTANVVTAVENFPRHRGTAVGIMKGFLGLSGAILIQVYQTIYKGNPSSFLLMIALLPSLTALILMLFVKKIDSSEGQDKKHLNGFSLISLVVAFYLMVLIIVDNIQPLRIGTRILTFSILMVLLISPLSVAIKAQFTDSPHLAQAEVTRLVDEPLLVEPAEQRRHEILVAEKLDREHNKMLYSKLPSDVGQESLSHDKIITRRGNLNLAQAICTSDFWLLFVAMSCAMGSGLATVNNISQIGGSLGYTSTETRTLVSLWSIWNFLGRFGAGYVSDYFLHSRGYPRPLFVAIALATMSIGHAVIASGFPGALYAGSVLVGVCYGSQWSLMPTITSEIFSLRHMGTIFNTIAIASPVGSYILSVWVVGYIYDMEASLSGENTCSGTHCFMLSFLILAAVTLFGFVVALALLFRTRRFYNQVIFSRLRHSVAL